MNTSDPIATLLETTHTIAVVGLSSDPAKPAHYVPAYLQEHGYRILPVNPNLQQALGETAYPDLASLPEAPDLVLIFRRSEAVPPVVTAAIARGAKAIWMQQGIEHAGAAAEARAAGLPVVMDACMMVEHRRRYPQP